MDGASVRLEGVRLDCAVQLCAFDVLRHLDLIVQHDERMTRDLGLDADQAYGRKWFVARCDPAREHFLNWKALTAQLCHGDAAVGFALVVVNRRVLPTKPRGDVCSIFFLSVDPEFQGRGIGSAMIRHIVQWATEQGIKQVRLHVMEHNVRAIHLYERLGFGVAGPLLKNYPQRGVNAWRLKMDLGLA